ncbi:MAG TPA: YceI family protein [Polyangiaceae bacterium]|jgi:polyisoprenoid-binding protein YceI
MALVKWDFDPAHSSIEFTVRHMLVSKVRGRFTKWSGSLEIDEQDWSRSRANVTIDVDSVDTHEAQRDAHLRSPDFFDAATHPRITFVSKRVAPRGENLAITGDLTIRGTTREVTLDVERGGLVAKDPWGKRRAGFTATATIDRKEFGVSFNQVLDQGGLALGDQVNIAIEIEATASVAANAEASA